MMATLIDLGKYHFDEMKRLHIEHVAGLLSDQAFYMAMKHLDVRRTRLDAIFRWAIEHEYPFKLEWSDEIEVECKLTLGHWL